MDSNSNVKILYVGATWKGSSARSLREALEGLPTAVMDEIGEDHSLPIYRSLPLRLSNRLLRPLQRRELEKEIYTKLDALKPNVLLVYKGGGVRADVIKRAKERGVLTVNVFPDYSPHSYGAALKEAMGTYDLVISTKPFHPENWERIYGYTNRCVFVPHGYDPAVHFWSGPPQVQDFDVVLAASWRPEYHELMLGFATEIQNTSLRVGIAGQGWASHAAAFPPGWHFAGPLYGRAYGEWVRRGKIVIAPVHSQVVVDGNRQPGDQDTTRTYELASAFCFFLHRRTPHASATYSESHEVPMWDSPAELAQRVREYLPLESVRREMAAAAHRRAVPAFSIPSRAEQVFEHVRNALDQKFAAI